MECLVHCCVPSHRKPKLGLCGANTHALLKGRAEKKENKLLIEDSFMISLNPNIYSGRCKDKTLLT